jgi:2-polyprenyl-3-methyl-5-hydroxy-6-metoxy-1,4-benzoquinol methylase
MTSDEYTSGYLSHWLQSKRFQKVEPYLRGRVLDYGCGAGALAGLCKRDSYMGMDVNDALIDMAKRNYPDYCFVVDVPETERFDTIVSLAVLEHVEFPGSLLRKFKEMLKPTGHIALTTPHPKFWGVHKAGSRIGIFSQYAGDDHKQKIDYHRMQTLARDTGLVVVEYSRFLFGANQLFILKHP